MVNLRCHTKDDSLPCRIVHLLRMLHGAKDIMLSFLGLVSRHIDARQCVHARRDSVVVAAPHVEVETLFSILGCVFHIAHAHKDKTQEVEAVGFFFVAAMIQWQRFQAIAHSLLILLVVVHPLCRPIPHLLPKGVGRGVSAEHHFLIDEIFFEQFFKKEVGGGRFRFLVKLLQQCVQMVLSHQAHIGQKGDEQCGHCTHGVCWMDVSHVESVLCHATS